MANILTPFGFRHIGFAGGSAPSFNVQRRKIALGNGNPIFHGDPVTSLTTGYIQQYATGDVVMNGVFQSCEYFSVSQQRKIRSNYWPGSDAQFDVDAFIINAPDALFVAACATGPLTYANAVDMNVEVVINTGGSATPTSGQGNTISQLSGAMLNGTPAATATLPFRVVRLYSDDVVPGAPLLGATSPNGADNSTQFNWAIVAFNQVSLKAGLLSVA